MGKIALQFKATLENITNICTEGDDFRWYMKVKCANCGETTDRFVYVCLEESAPLKGGRGSANLVLKCHLCSRENSISIIKESLGKYTIDNDNQFVSMVTFECRGIEPVDYQPTCGFVGESSESTTQFKEITFAEGDWTDYDENASVSVGIYDLEHRFVKA
ncbi:CXXC motif containing zinc binding protein [Octopus sinensis]|uniref:CXXC motif containing zinc binding protein n=1 Tax=Octopus sinensis TaxID=2607531 RepID=A0A6P7TFR3_9MOLL|nr:CXXC motif containing zinc binding protein [Octopus sinensis]